MSEQQIRYGGRNIPYSLQLNSRKRVRIEVLPSGNVQVLAPTGTDLYTIAQIVQGKARWIARQQHYFRQFEPRTTSREYVSGESHLYLGRRYRLRVHAVSDNSGVKMSGGYMHIFCHDAGDPAAKRLLLDAWYLERAKLVFGEAITKVANCRVFNALGEPEFSVRRMRRRWGSCTPKGRIVLNPDLIRAPRRCIEYVVAHELCHLLVPDHSLAFHRVLRRAVPDWRERKNLLERLLA